jgi:hypothetical protein
MKHFHAEWDLIDDRQTRSLSLNEGCLCYILEPCELCTHKIWYGTHFDEVCWLMNDSGTFEREKGDWETFKTPKVVRFEKNPISKLLNYGLKLMRFHMLQTKHTNRSVKFLREVEVVGEKHYGIMSSDYLSTNYSFEVFALCQKMVKMYERNSFFDFTIIDQAIDGFCDDLENWVVKKHKELLESVEKIEKCEKKIKDYEMWITKYDIEYKDGNIYQKTHDDRTEEKNKALTKLNDELSIMRIEKTKIENSICNYEKKWTNDTIFDLLRNLQK